MSKSNLKDLRIVYWNADGVGSKRSELLDMVSQLSVDIVALNETRLTPRMKLNFPGYAIYRQDKHSRDFGQGVALLVKLDIEHSLVPTPLTSNLEAIGIKLNIQNCNYTIFSVYQSPNLSLETSDIDALLKSDNCVLLMGDFNAKHENWSPGIKNPRGDKLFNHMINHDFVIYAPSESTLVHYQDYKPSTPDLVIASNIHNICDVRAIPALSSNHLPVFFRLLGYFERKIFRRYDYARSDWVKYRDHLNDHIFLSSRVFLSTEETDSAIETLSSSILQAREIAIPQVTIKNSTIRLSRKVKRLINARNKLRRSEQHDKNTQAKKQLRTQINFLTKNIRHGIKQNNDTLWNEKLKKVENPRSDLWRLAKSLKANASTSHIPPLKRDDGSITSTPGEQCEELANGFQQNMYLTANWHSEELEDAVKKSCKTLETLDSSFQVVHPSEIQRFIRGLKTRKAPGIDGMTNILIKHLPHKAVILLTKIFNACLSFAYFPCIWKASKIIAIKKPGKDDSIPTSYRPISLLPVLGKLFEKVINARLVKGTSNILINEQFGFRNSHSTVQQLARVAEESANMLNLGQSTGMFLLDMEKAFDTVWHKGLIHKLLVSNLPPKLIKIIDSYLSNRNFKVYIGDLASTSRNVPAGVPQGSILGPHLFLVYLNDIPKQNRTSLACFADDTACYTSSKDTELIIDRLQLAVNTLQAYFRKWKLKLNASKTEAIIFTRKRRIPTRTLTVDGHSVRWNASVKYLGIKLDRKLNWNDHIDHIRAKGMKAFNALTPLLSRRSVLSSHTKMKIYATLVRPCITYGCPVWGNTSLSNHKKIQVIQNRALKCSYNTPFKTNLNKLHTFLNFPTLFEHILKLTKKFYLDNCHTEHPNKIIKSLGQSRYKSRHKCLTRLPHHYVLTDE